MPNSDSKLTKIHSTTKTKIRKKIFAPRLGLDYWFYVSDVTNLSENNVNLHPEPQD